MQRICFFHGVEIFTLDILDQRPLEDLGLSQVLNDNLDGLQARFLARSPAPLTGNRVAATVYSGGAFSLTLTARVAPNVEVSQRVELSLPCDFETASPTYRV